MSKGPDAFRTISEVAEELDLPQHVLRFWETRFTHIKPMKRGGGRRYYRPDDVDLLRGIRRLLYGEGYTIKGVQRILREQGPRHVAALADGGHLDAVPDGPPDTDELVDDGDIVDGQDDADAAPNVRRAFVRPAKIEEWRDPERREPSFGEPRHYPETPPLVRANRQGGVRGAEKPRIPQAPPDLAASAEDFLPPLVADAPGPPQRDNPRSRFVDDSAPEEPSARLEPSLQAPDASERHFRPRSAGLSAEALDLLQATLIDLLECKRLLDQAR